MGACDQLVDAILAIITWIATVSCWCGTWCLLDSSGKWARPAVTGSAALVTIVALAAANVHRMLDTAVKDLPPVVAKVAVWLWTSLLAVLSIMTWRIAFWLVYHPTVLPPKNNFRAAFVILLGSSILVILGYLRTAAEAPPFGFAADSYTAGQRFTGPTFLVTCDSTFSDRAKESLHDICLTVPVVFVWAGVWIALDNFKVPLLASFFTCAIVRCIFGMLGADSCIRNTSAKSGAAAGKILVMAWTCIVTVFCIASWRAVWEMLLEKGHLHGQPVVAAAVALGGNLTLTMMHRHKSSLFPPMDFATDSHQLDAEAAPEGGCEGFIRGYGATSKR